MRGLDPRGLRSQPKLRQTPNPRSHPDVPRAVFFLMIGGFAEVYLCTLSETFREQINSLRILLGEVVS